MGTTDIQFMLTGSIKEAGLLVLLNQHIQRRWGESPLGEPFNVRTALSPDALLALVKQRIPADRMPVLVGVRTRSPPRHRLMARAGYGGAVIAVSSTCCRTSVLGAANPIVLSSSTAAMEKWIAPAMPMGACKASPIWTIPCGLMHSCLTARAIHRLVPSAFRATCAVRCALDHALA